MRSNIIKRAQEIVDNTPVDERPALDEWFTMDGFECNVTGSEVAFGVPEDGASVCVFKDLKDRDDCGLHDPVDIAIIEPVRINDVQRLSLAAYIADYIMEEQARGNTTVDKWMVSDAIEAYMGGAR